MSPALQHALAAGSPCARPIVGFSPFPLPSRVRGRSCTSAVVGTGRPGAGRSMVPKGEAQESDGHAAGSPRGQGGAWRPRGASWVQPLLARGHMVMSIDAFNTGAAKARRDMSDPFFTTYNRTDDSHRVQDILTAIAYLEGRPEVARVNLAGVGKGGLWCLLARALAPATPPHPGGRVPFLKRGRPSLSGASLRSGAETGGRLQDRLHAGAGNPAADPQRGRILRYRLVSAGL